MIGYVIFLGCTVVLAAVCMLGGKNIIRDNIESLVFAGGSTSGRSLTFSVFAAWMWTTSIIGGAETYSLYGFLGPISYVGGACIAFAGLIGFIIFLRRRMPMARTWLDFINSRYGRRAKQFYYLFAVLVPAYVLIEQGVGIAYILTEFYGSSFRIIAFLSVVLATVIVLHSGMRSTLNVEKLTAYIILAGLAAGIAAVSVSGISSQEISDMVSGHAGEMSLKDVAGPAIRYFIMAIVIAFGQIIFDPAWYFKASLARSDSQLIRSFTLGGILIWGSISLATSMYIGWIIANSGNHATDVFAGPAKAVFSIIIIFIGISTIAHYLMGVFGIFTTDLSTMLRPDDLHQTKRLHDPDYEKIIFGRVMLVAFGVFCASMTVALESVSLLSLDVFCAIFFSGACVPLIIGCMSQRNFGRLPVISSLAGIICGLLVWILYPLGQDNAQFLGMAASLILPLIIMSGGFLIKLPYDNQ